MKNNPKAVLYGVFLWLIPFAVSVMIFPLHQTERPLFESIMPVVVTVCAVVFSILYFRKVETGFLREGMLLGTLWLATSSIIDLPLFSAGPMKMTLADYLKDIGLTYLLIPTVTVGFGFMLQQKTIS